MPTHSKTVEKKPLSLVASFMLITGCLITTTLLAVILIKTGTISMNPAPGPFGNGTCYNDQNKPGEAVPCEATNEGSINLIIASGAFFGILAVIARFLWVIIATTHRHIKQALNQMLASKTDSLRS